RPPGALDVAQPRQDGDQGSTGDVAVRAEVAEDGVEHGGGVVGLHGVGGGRGVEGRLVAGHEVAVLGRVELPRVVVGGDNPVGGGSLGVQHRPFGEGPGPVERDPAGQAEVAVLAHEV